MLRKQCVSLWTDPNSQVTPRLTSLLDILQKEVPIDVDTIYPYVKICWRVCFTRQRS